MTRVSWHLSPHLSGLTFEYNTYGKSREYLLVKASFFLLWSVKIRKRRARNAQRLLLTVVFLSLVVSMNDASTWPLSGFLCIHYPVAGILTFTHVHRLVIPVVLTSFSFIFSYGEKSSNLC